MLFVLNNLSVGGSETKIIKIANALVQSGLDAEIVYLNGPETLLDEVDDRITVTGLERSGKYSIKALHRLRRRIQKERELILAVNLYPLLYLIPAAKWLRSTDARVVGLINTSLTIGRERRIERVYSPFLRQCDWTIFGCYAQQRDWIAKHGLDSHSSQVIYNGVDSEWYRPGAADEGGLKLRRALDIPEGAFTIGSVGRLGPEKSFDLLVKAAAQLNRSGRHCYVVLTGQGTEKKDLERLAKQEGIAEKIRFTGLLRDVRDAVTLMDIFVLPSSAVETFSNAALEAMAMAKPCILSDIGGASEMIEHGASGMLFPVGDLAALTQLLSETYDLPGMRNALGNAARERVVNSFGFSRMLEEYKALLKS
jgi:glycosyltransferase involved in cell wall biosynthesis